MARSRIKLYIGCGLTMAPEHFYNDVEELKKKLRETFEIFEFVGKVAGTPEDVYKWDIEHCVANCDLFVAIADYPSTGLGWELNEAILNGKPVLGVAHDKAVISRLVLGAPAFKPNFEFKRYRNLVKDLPILIENKAARIATTPSGSHIKG